MNFQWNSIVPGCVTPEGVATLSCIPAIFRNILNAAIIFGGIISIFFIITSGIKFITAGADPKQVDAARDTLVYAIIGLIVVLTSFFILGLISQTVGVPCIQSFGFGNCK